MSGRGCVGRMAGVAWMWVVLCCVCGLCVLCACVRGAIGGIGWVRGGREGRGRRESGVGVREASVWCGCGVWTPCVARTVCGVACVTVYVRV